MAVDAVAGGETVLVISDGLLPPQSARGITQTLEPIATASDIRRTINGVAIDLAPAQMKLYRTTIRCSDMNAPAFDDLEVGDIITIECVAELGYLTAGSPAAARRPIVSGSERTVGNYTYYRPILTLIVTNKSQEEDEVGARVAWTLEAEEVGDQGSP